MKRIEQEDDIYKGAEYVYVTYKQPTLHFQLLKKEKKTDTRESLRDAARPRLWTLVCVPYLNYLSLSLSFLPFVSFSL